MVALHPLLPFYCLSLQGISIKVLTNQQKSLQDNNLLGFTSFGNILWWWVLGGGGGWNNWNLRNSNFFQIKKLQFFKCVLSFKCKFNKVTIHPEVQTANYNSDFKTTIISLLSTYWTMSEYLHRYGFNAGFLKIQYMSKEICLIDIKVSKLI